MRVLAVLGFAAAVGVAGYQLTDGNPERVAAVDRHAPAAAAPQAAPAGSGPSVEDRYRAKELMDRMSADYGTVCQTPQGECIVAPAPIGSACSCGVPGSISR